MGKSYVNSAYLKNPRKIGKQISHFLRVSALPLECINSFEAALTLSVRSI